MPFTREQINDVKVIVKETISELLKDDKFLSLIVDRIEKKLGMKEQRQKVETLNKEIDVLKQQNKRLQSEMEDMQQLHKSKSLRIHGIQESTDENIIEKVLTIFRDKMEINVGHDCFENCFRIGKNANGKRTVLVTLSQQKIKSQILQNRRSLKGSGIVISEDMTAAKYSLFKLAIEKWGKNRVWFYEGNIRVKLGELKHNVKSKNDLDTLA